MLARLAVAAVIIGAAVACGPAPTAPPSKPAPSKAEGPPPKAAEAKPPEAKPAASPAAKAPEAWEQEWERVLAAASREGKVAVSGPSGPEARDALTEPFEKQFGISVDFFGGAARDLSARIMTERGAGQYLWDVFIGGTGTPFDPLIPAGALDPLEPALIFPDVKDPKNWRDGALEFFDEGRQVLVLAGQYRAPLYVNPDRVDPKQFTSYKDLLDPKWKGQLLMDDPRAPGPGQAIFLFLYMHPELGPEFIRSLARQEVLFLRDWAQEFDFIAQGRYLVLIGGSDAVADQRMRQGVRLAIVEPQQLRESTDVNSAFGTVALYNRAPHPNAAKVYINWLLSKEGQTAFARLLNYVSNRVDVPTDHVAAWKVPGPGSIKTHTWQAMQLRGTVVPFVVETFGLGS